MGLNLQNIVFEKSAQRLSQCPMESSREVAFAGRSNAGKSSAINALCNQKSLARTSKTPGRTQLLNIFTLDEQRQLVDLPGYGYAKVPVATRRQWGAMIEKYLSTRTALRGLVIVMDIRHPLTDYDWELLAWCAHAQLPTHILLTKADKLKRGPAQATLLSTQKALLDEGIIASVQVFSSLKRDGLDQAHAQLDEWLGFGETAATPD